ncbi:sigma-54-dependent transcriptional regulator [Candidatus Cloacimonadota bacterium]
MKIVLVDDDKLSRDSLYKFLTRYLNHEVTSFDSASAAENYIKSHQVELVISDIKMPGMNGIDLLQNIKSSDKLKDIDVILITGFGEVETAIQALRSGAYDYLQKPVDVDELAAVIERIQEKLELRNENIILNRDLKIKTEENFSTKIKLDKYQTIYREIFGLGKIAFYSTKMKEIEKLIDIYHADRDVNVLIQGETGTGKEVAARMIHYKEGEDLLPFVTVNCSAISPSLFESELFGYEAGAFTGAKAKGNTGKLDLAQGGSIFFDEIGDMPLEMQPKLLRVIQMKEFYRVGGNKPIHLDVRIIAATNRNLEDMVAEGNFRRDLLFRINTGVLNIPPLRERKDAIINLAKLFLQEFSHKKNKNLLIISDSAAKLLQEYEWKGNVRELKNVIERSVLLYDGTTLLPEHIVPILNIVHSEKMIDDLIQIKLKPDNFDYKLLEKEIISKILNHFDGNKSATAKYLNITRNRLNRKL